MTNTEAREFLDKHSYKDEYGRNVVPKKIAYIVADYLTDKEKALKDKKYDVYQGDRFTLAVKIASFETKLEAENYRDKAENESIKYDAYTCFYIEEVER